MLKGRRKGRKNPAAVIFHFLFCLGWIPWAKARDVKFGGIAFNFTHAGCRYANMGRLKELHHAESIALSFFHTLVKSIFCVRSYLATTQDAYQVHHQGHGEVQSFFCLRQACSPVPYVSASECTRERYIGRDNSPAPKHDRTELFESGFQGRQTVGIQLFEDPHQHARRRG